ncbi:Pr6Pr family membrane protein [Albibacterium bauzanense]|uniref:FAR-17a/AIG1-like protein n=1 Tax=Albibacterium bauzanense TaxID=653929 RepID=A0A4R1LTR6_9SPHI|nr:Pr6Pr family membrane protein [Albibacterium bauzanense]TCK80659.1 hypothetical protein C8N28_2404 [Albibacterium bauzanense]
MDQHKTVRVIATLCALLVWATVILQFILIIQNRTYPVPETIIQFFSYFTILTNILVACCFTTIAIKREPYKTTFFANPGVLAATVVNITIVGSVYNLILRALWTPTGLQLLADEFLHTIIPILYITFWLIAVPKIHLHWSRIFNWLYYPLGYFIIILFSGSLSGFYPYPFINVTELGWSQVIINSIFITAAFIFLSLLIVFISRMMQRNKHS